MHIFRHIKSNRRSTKLVSNGPFPQYQGKLSGFRMLDADMTSKRFRRSFCACKWRQKAHI